MSKFNVGDRVKWGEDSGIIIRVDAAIEEEERYVIALSDVHWNVPGDILTLDQPYMNELKLKKVLGL